MSCTIGDCCKPVKSRGMCPMHWKRWRAGKDLIQPQDKDRGTARDRVRDTNGLFSSAVARTKIEEFRELLRVAHVEDTGYLTPCWVSDRTPRKDGYTQVRREGQMWVTHRWAKTLAIGPIPEKLHCDHLCRVRSCFRPSHLEPVTPLENVRRGAAARRLEKNRG